MLFALRSSLNLVLKLSSDVGQMDQCKLMHPKLEISWFQLLLAEKMVTVNGWFQKDILQQLIPTFVLLYIKKLKKYVQILKIMLG